MGTFGPSEITVPRARLAAGEGTTRQWKRTAMRAYQRRTLAADVLIASTYLAGTNTRRSRGLIVCTSRRSCRKAGKAQIFPPVQESSGESRLMVVAVQPIRSREDLSQTERNWFRTEDCETCTARNFACEPSSNCARKKTARVALYRRDGRRVVCPQCVADGKISHMMKTRKTKVAAKAKPTARAKTASARSRKGGSARVPARTVARNRPSPQSKLAELKSRLLEISDLSAAGALLNWDQATYMPTGGAPARARQGGTLSRLAHEKSAAPALGRLIDALAPFGESLPYESDEASLIRIARRDFEKARKVPAEFIARLSAFRLGVVRRLDAGAAGERFRRHAALSRNRA